MGLGDFIQKQFLDIIQWTEATDDVLAWRFPTADMEIQQGAELTVRESQVALFVDQGRVADRFGPGQYRLHTRNLPVLSDLRHWDKKFESPFKSEVYFFSTRLRLGQTWGTPQPVTVRDKEFGAVRVRAFGVYSFRITNAVRFFLQTSGTRPSYLLAELEGPLRAALGSSLAQHMGTSGVPFIDMASQQTALAAGVRDHARSQFETLGLELESVQIQSLSLPEELQQRLDERISMGMVGDLERYTQYQAARAIPIAAANPGGVAGAAVGIGAGVALGQTMTTAVTRSQKPVPAAADAPPSAAAPSIVSETVVCGRCQARLEQRTRFCPDCGTQLG